MLATAATCQGRSHVPKLSHFRRFRCWRTRARPLLRVDETGGLKSDPAVVCVACSGSTVLRLSESRKTGRRGGSLARFTPNRAIARESDAFYRVRADHRFLRCRELQPLAGRACSFYRVDAQKYTCALILCASIINRFAQRL